MPNSSEFQIHLVPPQIWEPILAEATKEKSPALVQVITQAILTLHNQHVGVTPALLAELAPALLDVRYHLAETSTWGLVLARLARALTDESQTGEARSGHRVGLLLSRTPAYTLLRVVAPLINAACRHLGRSYLFCGDAIDAFIDRRQYEAYSKELDAALRALTVTGNGDPLDLFWRERALALSVLSRQVESASPTSPLPDPDPQALAMLLRLRPELSDRDQEQKLRRLTTLRRQRSIRQREEGVAGIRVTRREEDLGEALLSEFVNDPITRAERFFNTGFLALERQPKRTKLRDVLIVGMLPGELTTGVSADFVKACWFDFVMRLGLILHRLGLQRTEFRWIEGDNMGRSRTASFLLGEMPEIFALYEGQPSAAYRQAYLDVLRWLPRFLDSRSDYQPLPELTAQSHAEPDGVDNAFTSFARASITGAEQWLTAAWAVQQEAVGWQSPIPLAGQSAPGGRLSAMDFAYTHLMSFLPPPPRPPDADPDERQAHEGAMRARLATLSGRLQARNRFQGSASITWLPSAPDETTTWRVDAPHMLRARLFGDEEEPDLTLPQLAGKLEGVWLQAIVAEVTRA